MVRSMLCDFSEASAADAWVAVNDAVMGGRSQGSLERTAAGTVLFSGRVSFDNGGGFASVRTKPRRHDLRDHAAVGVRVRGDGRRYKLNLKTDGHLDGVLYRVAFDTRRDTWQTLVFPFEEFDPTFRGRVLPDAPPLDRSSIVSLGLMISDRREGPFRLEVAWIDAV